MIPWKDLREIFRGAIGTLLAKRLGKSETVRIQLDGDLYLRPLQLPIHPEGTVLIIRGGIHHIGDGGYYVDMSCLFLPKFRVYLLEKFRPIVNFDFSEDIGKSLRYLRNVYGFSPLIVLGFSIGGILTWSYLSSGLDEADLYVPVSTPINLKYFLSDYPKHVLYSRMHAEMLKSFGVSNDTDLLKLAGSTPEQRQEEIDNFLPKLLRTQSIWQDKTFPVVGSQDVILSTYNSDLRYFPVEPHALILFGASHCCMDVILGACLVIRTFVGRKINGAQLYSEVLKRI